MDEMANFWKNYADVIAFVNYTPWESSYDNPVNNLEHPCDELWTRMFVWADGKVNPCDYDYKSYLSKWNLNDSSLASVWLSEFYQELRKAHINKNRKKFEPCKRCLN